MGRFFRLLTHPNTHPPTAEPLPYNVRRERATLRRSIGERCSLLGLPSFTNPGRCTRHFTRVGLY